jgi:hypothetical protein
MVIITRAEIYDLELSQNSEDVIARRRAEATKPVLDHREGAISNQVLNPITGGMLRALPLL